MCRQKKQASDILQGTVVMIYFVLRNVASPRFLLALSLVIFVRKNIVTSVFCLCSVLEVLVTQNKGASKEF